MIRSVVIRAPAKVNLFLEVLARRPDGFHDIATLMAKVGLFDALEFRLAPDGELHLFCDHPNLSTDSDNLICRAAQRLRTATGCARGARVALTKRIPMAAGLAGGSSDAAATLLGLNELWDLRLPTHQLAELAAELGSDVPFFLDGPAAWCTGRGEIVQPAPIGRPLDLVLLCPTFGLPTALVYSCVQVPDSPVNGSAARTALAQGDVDALGRSLHNRLQSAAEQIRPELRDYRDRLQTLGTAGVLMSGSGSSVLGLCRNRREALRTARQLKASFADEPPPRPQVFLVRSCV